MSRITALDYARGFTVLCIPAIHTVMVFSDTRVYTTIFGYALTFIAEGPGAQLFMTIMGIAFTMRKRHRTPTILLRAFLLLLAGYALNIAKFVLPELLFGLPPGVYRDLAITSGPVIPQLLGIRDILHFAAVALLVLHCIYRLRNDWCWAPLGALAIAWLGPLIYDSSTNYLVEWCTGGPPRVFFPVLPWLVYPLMGLSIGFFLKRNPLATFRRLPPIGIFLIAAGAGIAWTTGGLSREGFYRTDAGETMIHAGIVLLTLYTWHRISRRFHPPTPFLQLLAYCSKHITAIYVIQWVLICWLLPLVGYQTLNELQSVMMAVYVTMLVFTVHKIIIPPFSSFLLRCAARR